MIYLDHNASSPLLPVARDAWLGAEERFPGNPSSPHRVGARAEAALAQARDQLAGWLGCSPLEIVWTSGATEAANAVLHHVAESADPAAAVWVSAIEHPAILATARERFGARVRTVPCRGDGVVDVAWLEAQRTRERPALVALMAANNETGVLQPWREAQVWCAMHGVPLLCDATQWCGRLAARTLGTCDFVIGSGHKFGGPRGVGFLKVSLRESRFHRLIHGGNQQDGRRAGTENVSGILAMIAALDWCEQQIAMEAAQPHAAARNEFERRLCGRLPAVAVNGGTVERLWNTSSVVLPEIDCRQRWVVKLDKAGFAVSTGSACASGAEKPSHVLAAMGLTPAIASRVLRISAGWQTPPTAWGELLQAIVQLQRDLEPAAAARP